MRNGDRVPGSVHDPLSISDFSAHVELLRLLVEKAAERILNSDIPSCTKRCPSDTSTSSVRCRPDTTVELQ